VSDDNDHESPAEVEAHPSQPMMIPVPFGGRGPHRFGPFAYREPRRCSFCGRRARSVGHLVRSRTAVICDACIRQISELLGRTDTHQREVRFKPVVPVPANRTEAERDIEAAYERVFDSDAGPEDRGAAIEDGDNLVASIVEAGRRTPGRRGVEVFVDYIRFIADDEAEVRFTLALGTPGAVGPMQLDETGFAVLTDNGWKVARATWCGLVTRVGIECPPPGSAPPTP